MIDTLDIVSIMEDAAITAFQFKGKGLDYKKEADKAATEIIRTGLNKLDMCGTVIMGEGEKDESFGLYHGETVGNGCQSVDIAIDPIEGTRPTVEGADNAISTVAFSFRYSMLHLEPYYVNKLAYGKYIKESLNGKLLLLSNVSDICKSIKEAIGCNPFVTILNRDRHKKAIQEFRNCGCYVHLIDDCDLTSSLSSYLSEYRGIGRHSIVYGIGGSAEATLMAAVAKCTDGRLEVNWEGHPEILTENKLIRDHCIFIATAITKNNMMAGVSSLEDTYRHESFHNVYSSESLFLNSVDRAIRWIKTRKKLEV